MLVQAPVVAFPLSTSDISMADKAQETQTAPQPAANTSKDEVPGGDGMSVPSGDKQKGTEDPQNLDQIREILFGRQRDEFQERFEQLEEQLKKDATELQKDYEARFESMEKRFQGEAKKITDRLEAEGKKRLEALDALNTSLKEKEASLSKALQDETGRLEKALESRSEELQASLTKHVARLANEKTSRKDLARFFSEVAAGLVEGLAEET